MDAVSKENNELSAKRIALQKSFKEYNEKNGFSYEDWVNPPAGHFYEGTKMIWLLSMKKWHHLFSTSHNTNSDWFKEAPFGPFFILG